MVAAYRFLSSALFFSSVRPFMFGLRLCPVLPFFFLKIFALIFCGLVRGFVHSCLVIMGFCPLIFFFADISVFFCGTRGKTFSLKRGQTVNTAGMLSLRRESLDQSVHPPSRLSPVLTILSKPPNSSPY